MSKRSTPYWFIAPFLLSFVLFWVYPIVNSFILGFTDTRVGTMGNFIGLDNFKRMLNDSRFWTAILNTFGFTLVYVVMLVMLDFVIALLLNSKNTPFL